MRSSARFAAALFPLTFALPLFAQNPAPATPGDKAGSSDSESKLAVVLRSYSLLDAEADRLKAANAKLTAENAALEAKLAELQAAVPIAAQVAGLRDQLRQTQAQMAAYAEENVQLRTRIGLLADPNRVTPTPVAMNPAPPPAPAANPSTAQNSQRTHVIAAGDTLAKISQTYYGTQNRWTEIRDANHLRDGMSLVIGRTLIVP